MVPLLEWSWCLDGRVHYPGDVGLHTPYLSDNIRDLVSMLYVCIYKVTSLCKYVSRKLVYETMHCTAFPLKLLSRVTHVGTTVHDERSLGTLYGAERTLDVRPLDGFPAFHGTRRFNTQFTTALHLFPCLARPIQSTSPHPNSPRSILILSTHLRLGLPSGLFPSGLPTNNL
jgi:hypothetical protein